MQLFLFYGYISLSQILKFFWGCSDAVVFVVVVDVVFDEDC
jgi:hypothetical protein